MACQVTTNSCYQGVQFLNYHYVDDDQLYDGLVNRAFNIAMVFTEAHWREDTMGPRTPLAVFNYVKSTCGIDVIPCLEVTVDEMGTREQNGRRRGQKEREREKSLKVIFGWKDGDGFMAVTFVLEKTRVNESLQDLAAEAFARQMKTRWDIEGLDVAKSRTSNAKKIVDRVLDKFKYIEWIEAHVKLTAKQWKEMYEKEKEKNVTAEKTIKKLEEQQLKAAERMEKELARLQEQVTQMKAAEQINAVVSKKQQEALEEQQSQNLTAERLEEQQQNSVEAVVALVVQHEARVKTLKETIRESDNKKRRLEKELDRLQEQVTQLKAAEQINAVVSGEQQENANVKEEVQLSQPRKRKREVQLGNEIKGGKQGAMEVLGNKIKGGKQGAMEVLRDANQSLTLSAAVTKEETLP